MVSDVRSAWRRVLPGRSLPVSGGVLDQQGEEAAQPVLGVGTGVGEDPDHSEIGSVPLRASLVCSVSSYLPYRLVAAASHAAGSHVEPCRAMGRRSGTEGRSAGGVCAGVALGLVHQLRVNWIAAPAEQCERSRGFARPPIGRRMCALPYRPSFDRSFCGVMACTGICALRRGRQLGAGRLDSSVNVRSAARKLPGRCIKNDAPSRACCKWPPLWCHWGNGREGPPRPDMPPRGACGDFAKRQAVQGEIKRPEASIRRG